jgi:hypothetical protein
MSIPVLACRVRALSLGFLLLGGAGCSASDHCVSGARCGDAGSLVGASPLGDASAAQVVQVDAACAMQSIRAQRGAPKPVDVVFVIDNSGSMSDEIAQVRANINEQFASIIAASGVDFRVIMISAFGVGGTDICIEPPLAGASCNSGLAATNGEHYFHYSQEIGSNDALCQMLATFTRPDSAKRFPNGWQAALRPEAQKALVMISDDSAHCAYQDGHVRVEIGGDGADPFDDALTFHKALLAQSSQQFGVPPDIKYQFFSIVGMAPNTPASEPFFPYQALQASPCDTAPTPGLSYQALSIITDALRYPVCEGRSFDAVFRVLARSVVQASKADCLFELPTAQKQGQAIELADVNLEYRSGGGTVRRFSQVQSSSACKNDHSFFVQDRIELCPAACALVQADTTPEIDILYGCTRIPS